MFVAVRKRLAATYSEHANTILEFEERATLVLLGRIVKQGNFLPTTTLEAHQCLVVCGETSPFQDEADAHEAKVKERTDKIKAAEAVKALANQKKVEQSLWHGTLIAYIVWDLNTNAVDYVMCAKYSCSSKR